MLLYILRRLAQSALVTGHEAMRYGNAHASIVPYQSFHASDRSFALGCGTDRHFRALCERVLQRPELAGDPRFASNESRVRNRDVLLPLLADCFRAHTASTWVRRCRAAQIPASLVQGVREALATPEGRVVVADVEHPDAGRYETVGNPLRLDGLRPSIRSAPPRFGAQTSKILRELGFSAAEIAKIRRNGASR